jgi:predicted transcriptional regulator
LPGKGNPKVTIRLRPRLLMVLDGVAARKGKSRTSIIRQAIHEFLEREVENT